MYFFCLHKPINYSKNTLKEDKVSDGNQHSKNYIHNAEVHILHQKVEMRKTIFAEILENIEEST